MGKAGREKRRFRDGDVRFEAHLDDYAFLISGLLDLYQASFDHRWLNLAEELMGKTITVFWDSAEGGFYDTSGKDTSILVRMKEAYDGAEPTGNSVAAMDLLRLYHYTNDTTLKGYAEKTVKYFCTLLEQSPQIMPQLMASAEYLLANPEHIVIHAESISDAASYLDIVVGKYLPHANIIVIDNNNKPYYDATFSFTKGMGRIDGKTTAYVCKNYACQLPVNDYSLFREQVSSHH